MSLGVEINRKLEHQMIYLFSWFLQKWDVQPQSSHSEAPAIALTCPQFPGGQVASVPQPLPRMPFT